MSDLSGKKYHDSGIMSIKVYVTMDEIMSFPIEYKLRDISNHIKSETSPDAH
jgi:hypothetical protein